MTNAANVAIFITSFSSMLWGFVNTKFKFTTLFSIICLNTLIINLLYPWAIRTEVSYALADIVLESNQSGVAVTLLTVIPKIYGLTIGGNLLGFA